MDALIPVLVGAVGALLYGLTEGKPSELGRLSFQAAMIGLMIAFATKAVHLF